MPTTVQLLLVDQFLRTFQESNKVPEQEMLDAINAQLEGIRQCVRASLTKQEELLSDLQTKFEAYFGRKKSAESSSLISQLTAAVDSFLALDRDVKEGMKFYAELTDRCLKVQDKVCQSIFFSCMRTPLYFCHFPPTPNRNPFEGGECKPTTRHICLGLVR